jgi:hypothetical protein
MKFLSVASTLCLLCFYGISMPAFAQEQLRVQRTFPFFPSVSSTLNDQPEVLHTFPLSPSASLIIKFAKEPVFRPTGASGLTRIKRIYIIAARTGFDSDVVLDRVELEYIQGSEDNVFPRFAIYAAGLDGENLLYLFTKEGRMFMGSAHLSASGSVSNYRQQRLRELAPNIELADFVKNQDGKATLRIRDNSRAGRHAYQFDEAGNAFSVPAEPREKL